MFEPTPSGVSERRDQLFGGLCALVFLVNFGRVAFAPLVDEFVRTFQIGEGTAGLVATLVWLGSALMRLPTGYLLTRWSRHRVVLGTGVALTGAAAFTATADTVATVGAGAFCIGLASGVYFIAANPLVTELFPDHVGQAIGVHGTASQLAAVAAPAAIGVTLIVAPWQAVFAAMAVAAFLTTAALTLVATRATLPTVGTADRDLVGAVRQQWPFIVAGIVLVGFAAFVWNGVFNFYVRYLSTVKGLGPSTARTVLTITFAAGVPAFFFSGRLADQVSYVPLMLGILGTFATALLALTVAGGLLAVIGVSLLLGFAIHSLFPAVDTYLLASLSDETRASAYATFSAGMMAIQATGSVVLGTLVEAGVAYDTVFQVAAVGVIAVAAVAGAAHRAGWVPTGQGGA